MWTTRFASILMCWLLVLQTNVAFSQTYERYRLPAGSRLTVGTQTYQGFNLGEYQELLRMDADLRHLTALTGLLTSQNQALQQTITALRGTAELDATSIQLLTTDRDRLREQWQRERDLRLELENRPDWSWLGWVVAGAFAVATIVLAFVVGVQ